MPTTTLKVNSGPDDGHMAAGMPYNNVIITDMGAFITAGSPDPRDAWFRFRNVQIPRGATINLAKLRFLCAQTQSTPAVNLKIMAEAADNVAAPPGYDYYNRSRTAAVVLWHGVATWIEGNLYESPDISSVIQELVNRLGWTPGNAILIFVQNDGSIGDGNVIRQCVSFDGDPAGATELEVTYAEAVVQFTLSVRAGAGGTTDTNYPPGNYLIKEGETASIEAIPSSGYDFAGWLLDGVDYGAGNPTSVLMDADHVLEAQFTPVTHTVQVQSSPISAVPVTIDGSSVGSTPTSPITLEEGEHTVTVPEEVVA